MDLHTCARSPPAEGRRSRTLVTVPATGLVQGLNATIQVIYTITVSRTHSIKTRALLKRCHHKSSHKSPSHSASVQRLCRLPSSCLQLGPHTSRINRRGTHHVTADRHSSPTAPLEHLPTPYPAPEVVIRSTHIFSSSHPPMSHCTLSRHLHPRFKPPYPPRPAPPHRLTRCG